MAAVFNYYYKITLIKPYYRNLELMYWQFLAFHWLWLYVKRTATPFMNYSVFAMTDFLRLRIYWKKEQRLRATDTQRSLPWVCYSSVTGRRVYCVPKSFSCLSKKCRITRTQVCIISCTLSFMNDLLPWFLLIFFFFFFKSVDNYYFPNGSWRTHAVIMKFLFF